MIWIDYQLLLNPSTQRRFPGVAAFHLGRIGYHLGRNLMVWWDSREDVTLLGIVPPRTRVKSPAVEVVAAPIFSFLDVAENIFGECKSNKMCPTFVLMAQCILRSHPYPRSTISLSSDDDPTHDLRRGARGGYGTVHGTAVRVLAYPYFSHSYESGTGTVVATARRLRAFTPFLLSPVSIDIN